MMLHQRSGYRLITLLICKFQFIHVFGLFHMHFNLFKISNMKLLNFSNVYVLFSNIYQQ